jgi:caffeoyl-CoA O-methyltransferase
MSFGSDILQNYMEAHSGSEDEILYALNRETFLKVLNPRMLSGQIQGKFLEFISRMLTPDHILEIGTFTGYSAICLARGLKNGGKLVTIEKNDELSWLSNKYFHLAGLDDRIELRIGNALDIIPELDQTFDLVYIDGEKEEYLGYYQRAVVKVRSGGYLIADNVLWAGKVLGEAKPGDADTLSIQQFNDFVKADPRVENIILSVRDGLNLIRKK